MKRWILTESGWKWICAIAYVSICVFDFVIVPMWFGVVRYQQGSIRVYMENISQFDPTIQVELIRAFTFQHEPFTLKGGGLFHLAFGALLTGAALNKTKPEE